MRTIRTATADVEGILADIAREDDDELLRPRK